MGSESVPFQPEGATAPSRTAAPDRFTELVFDGLYAEEPTPEQLDAFANRRRVVPPDAMRALEERAQAAPNDPAIAVVVHVLRDPNVSLVDQPGSRDRADQALDLLVRLPIAVAFVQRLRAFRTPLPSQPRLGHVRNLLWLSAGREPGAFKSWLTDLEIGRWYRSRKLEKGDEVVLDLARRGEPIERAVAAALRTLDLGASPLVPDGDPPYEPPPIDTPPNFSPDPEHSPVLTGGTGGRWATAWAKKATPSTEGSDCGSEDEDKDDDGQKDDDGGDGGGGGVTPS